MNPDSLDPVIHVPARLRLMVTLAALPEGDSLSFTRLQEIIGLTPGNLITHLRKLQDAGYIRTDKTTTSSSHVTAVSLTPQGRTALSRYSAALRELLDAADATLTPRVTTGHLPSKGTGHRRATGGRTGR